MHKTIGEQLQMAQLVAQMESTPQYWIVTAIGPMVAVRLVSDAQLARTYCEAVQAAHPTQVALWGPIGTDETDLVRQELALFRRA